MVLPLTRLNVADNAGAFEVMCVGVLGNKLYKRVACIGDVLVVVVKRINPKKNKFKKGVVRMGLVVRAKRSYKRYAGIYLNFDDNAVIMVNKKHAPMSKRLKGPVVFEVCKKFKFVGTLAKNVL